MIYKEITHFSELKQSKKDLIKNAHLENIKNNFRVEFETCKPTDFDCGRVAEQCRSGCGEKCYSFFVPENGASVFFDECEEDELKGYIRRNYVVNILHVIIGDE